MGMTARGTPAASMSLRKTQAQATLSMPGGGGAGGATPSASFALAEMTRKSLGTRASVALQVFGKRASARGRNV